MRAAADVLKLVCLFFLTTLLSMSFAQEVSLSGATSFGDVEIGQSIEQTFTVKNNKRVEVVKMEFEKRKLFCEHYNNERFALERSRG